ncbi:MAG: DeoR/GlpR family DNA-binding transcription regulator [Spirochaetota bacterium]
MLAEQRRRLIVTALERSSFVALCDAVELTGASEATVRRDFSLLETEGVVRRHRGGVEIRRRDGAVAGRTTSAPRSEPLVSLPLDLRLAVQDEAKRMIADRAAIMCAEGRTVFLDAGSTALRLAHHLAAMPVRVLTNSFAAARVLFDGGVAEVVLTGGQIDRSSEVVFSYEDVGIIESYPPDVAFLGAQGIDENGYYNSDERLIRLERQVARVASRTVLVADGSKFGKRGRIRVAPLSELNTIVTDGPVGEQYESVLAAAGVELIKVR